MANDPNLSKTVYTMLIIGLPLFQRVQSCKDLIMLVDMNYEGKAK